MAPVVQGDENSTIFESEKLWIAVVLALLAVVSFLMGAIVFCACGGKNEGKAGEKEPEKAATYLDLDPGGPAAEPKADTGAKGGNSGLSPPPAVPSNSKSSSGGSKSLVGKKG